MKKFISIPTMILICVSLCLSLAACGGTNMEKAKKVQDDYAALVNEHNEVTTLFGEAQAVGVPLEQSVIDEYNGAVAYVNEFGQVKLDGKKDSEMDQYISEISEYRNILKTLKTNLQAAIDVYSGQEGEEDMGDYGYEEEEEE